MPLTYDVLNIDPIAKEEGFQSSITTAVIWSTIAVGMPMIKEDNYEEFFTRLQMSETVYGAQLVGADGKDYSITLEDVKRRIGLKTNATSYTKTTFGNHVRRIVRERAERTLTQQRELLRERAEQGDTGELATD